jgi:hypothetical protein
MKTCIPPVLITVALACFALLPRAQAVVPAPDGGYPGGNTAEGLNALFSLTNGTHNTAVGENALRFNSGGDNNTATGFFSLRSNTFGNQNTANGALALANNDTGRDNTASGFQALLTNTTGSENTATGLNALRKNTTGISNSANGSGALYSNTTGRRNTAIGLLALSQNTIGNFNVALGDGAGNGVITADDVICIGHGITGANVSNTCFIGNIRGVTTQNANALPVLIDGAGQLGTASSSQRFKHDIKPMGKASEALLALEPVTFHYKSDSANIPQFGLVAEEVEKVNPDLVVRGADGKVYTVRYDAVNAMLLNEFLKEHRKVEEHEATIAELKSTVSQQQRDFQATAAHQQKQIEALTEGLQKVSAQLEASRPAPQVVNNP